MEDHTLAGLFPLFKWGSWPGSSSSRLTHGECVPVSRAVHLAGIAAKTSFIAYRLDIRYKCSPSHGINIISIAA